MTPCSPRYAWASGRVESLAGANGVGMDRESVLRLIRAGEDSSTEFKSLAATGFASIEERGTTCCYAKQDKFWVDGAPNEERWEIYTVLADAEMPAGQLRTVEPDATADLCCSAAPESGARCC